MKERETQAGERVEGRERRPRVVAGARWEHDRELQRGRTSPGERREEEGEVGMGTTCTLPIRAFKFFSFSLG